MTREMNRMGPNCRRSMTDRVDSYRFLDPLTRQVVKAWIRKEPSREIPWTPLSKPLSECTVAAISSGGIALKGDEPFDQESERRNPWWGDPSYRIIPAGSSAGDVEFYHLHIDSSFARGDLNCLLPLDRLEELAQKRRIGRSAARHYSYMGYILDPTVLLEVTTPKIIGNLEEDGVDVILLVPT
jgi:D-proline reductase (dithiol) PrdB